MNNLITAYEAMNKNGMVVQITTTSTELVEFGGFLIDSVIQETKDRIKKGEEDALLTVDEAMKRLKVKSRATLWRWEQKAYLKPVKSGGKSFYKMSDIERLLTSKTPQR